jgi:hypothetical protein
MISKEQMESIDKIKLNGLFVLEFTKSFFFFFAKWNSQKVVQRIYMKYI